MARAGMDVARLNFSHSTHSEHKKRIALLRRVASDLNKCISIVADLQGPKIRVGKFKNGHAEIKTGKEFTITTDNIIGDGHRVSTGYSDLPKLLKAGDTMFLDDGELKMKVIKVAKKEVTLKVLVGGVLKDKKGINLPGISSDIAAVTKKDKEDLAFALENDVDFVAVSFVRKPDDILTVKNIISKSGKVVPVIAKLEKPEAIKNLDLIIKESDGVMIARGDLGVEINPERVPVLQKNIIKKANKAGKFVITATQMLDSMTTHPRPTRAEASDVANAIFDGTDALMLSGETAAGSYPVKSVRMMARIVSEVEKSNIFGEMFARKRFKRDATFSETIAHAAKNAAHELDVKAIAAFTMSGYTGKLISNVRPKTPIVCFTPDEHVVRELNIYWGVKPVRIRLIQNFENVIGKVESELMKRKIAKKGDVIIIICGMPIIATGQTNLLKIHTIEGGNA
jgi:pyruvate kinase